MNKEIFDLQAKQYKEYLKNPAINYSLCPICLRKLYRNDESSTDGHIWPKYLRKLGEDSNQNVILCNKCNNESGRFGESNLQNYQKYKRHDLDNLQNHFKTKIDLVIDDDEFDKWKTANKNGNDSVKFPTISIKPVFNNNSGEMINQKQIQKINHLVIPYALLNSAYLYSFYAFGYEYISSDLLNGIRTLIQNSFREKPQIIFDNSIIFGISVDEKNNEIIPTMSLLIPYGIDNNYISLIIRYLEYTIRLPFLLNQKLFMKEFLPIVNKNCKRVGEYYIDIVKGSQKLESLELIKYMIGNELLGIDSKIIK